MNIALWWETLSDHEISCYTINVVGVLCNVPLHRVKPLVVQIDVRLNLLNLVLEISDVILQQGHKSLKVISRIVHNLYT